MTGSNLFRLLADIEPRLAAAFPEKERIQVAELAGLGQGWESELYELMLEHGPAGERRRERLVLRLYSGDNGAAKAGHEFRSMRRLLEAGYPVPRVYLLGDERSPLGQPFILMEKIPGKVLGERIYDAPEQQQREMLGLFCGLFVQLHDLDWQPFVEDTGQSGAVSPFYYFDRWLENARHNVQRFSMPGFLPALAWLEWRRARLPCARPSPVHQDFHPSNILIRPDGSPAVIDWTSFDVSDARFDLAWTLILATMYLDLEWRERIREEYERQRGSPVEEIEVFEVAACLRRLFDLAVSLSMGAGQMGMRASAVEQMKSQLESYRLIYAMLVEFTGTRIPEVEALVRPD